MFPATANVMIVAILKINNYVPSSSEIILLGHLEIKIVPEVLTRNEFMCCLQLLPQFHISHEGS